uniref:Uncharacterized protein n=1 Tax=Psilocybe cubensis TaxID=181762 RepID=A0A8H7XLX9_PSICU
MRQGGAPVYTHRAEAVGNPWHSSSALKRWYHTFVDGAALLTTIPPARRQPRSPASNTSIHARRRTTAPENHVGNQRNLVIVGDGACGKVYVPTVFENSVANVEVDALMCHTYACLPLILVVCKTDLRPDSRVIEEFRMTSRNPLKEGMAVAQKIGAKHYLECSAKSGEGVREVFQYATRAALLSRGKGKKSHHCIVL